MIGPLHSLLPRVATTLGLIAVLALALSLTTGCLESFNSSPAMTETDRSERATVERDESYADNFANRYACLSWARFIDQQSRRILQHSSLYGPIGETRFEQVRRRSLSLNFLLELEGFDLAQSWGEDGVDDRLVDALNRTRQYGQGILSGPRDSTFPIRALTLSFVDNFPFDTASANGSDGTAAVHKPEFDALREGLGGSSLGQLCLAGGFAVPNTAAFAGAANITQPTVYSGPDHVTFCTLYANGVDAAYLSSAKQLADFPQLEKHRFALALDVANEGYIVNALGEISSRQLRRSLQEYREFDPNDPDLVDKIIEQQPTRVAESNNRNSTLSVVQSQLIDLLSRISIHFTVSSAITDDLSAMIDAATLDMLTLSSACKDAGQPYASAHQGLV